jgi:hypothetical protein
MKLGKTTPILRIFDEAKAKEFYVEFLGFAQGYCVLHLSEHHGDGSPGAAIRIETDDPFGNCLTFFQAGPEVASPDFKVT